MEKIAPVVLLNFRSEPCLVFAKGRKNFHAVAAQGRVIHLVTFDTLEGLRPAERKGKPYPPRRAASFWLNHSSREITKRAKQVLRGLVKREAAASAASEHP